MTVKVGVYICSLCNPQNLNIGELLGSAVPDSPFYRILTSPSSPPRQMIMVANSQTPNHQRLWCALEAHVSLNRKRISRVRITGHAHYLLTSSDSTMPKNEIDSFLVDVAPLIEKAEIMATALSLGEIDKEEYLL